MTTQGAMPVGRDEVVTAVLAHAADLFAERGPAATSIRDIANRSGVNHGLIFRHLGTKEQLVGAVLDQLAQKMSLLLESGASQADVEAHGERHSTVLARAILDGFPVGELQRRFPGAALVVGLAEKHHENQTDARIAAANALALQMGWRLFGPFLRSATGLDDVSEKDLKTAVESCAAGLLGARSTGDEPTGTRIL